MSNEAQIVDTNAEQIVEQVREQLANANVKKAPLFKKLSEVLKAVERVPKNGWNDFHKYKYTTESDLTDGIRPILAEAGLMLWTSIEHQERNLTPIYNKYKLQDPPHQKWYTKVKVKFIIGCTETGETLESYYWGEGEDESDKGLYKAYTGAVKYFLMKTFLIPTGDEIQPTTPTDPEFTGRNGQNPPQQQKQQQRPNNAPAPMTTQERGQMMENAGQPSKASLVAKWKTLGGTDADFEPFYTKQMGDGRRHTDIDRFLTQKLMERQKQQEQTQQPEPQPEQQNQK